MESQAQAQAPLELEEDEEALRKQAEDDLEDALTASTSTGTGTGTASASSSKSHLAEHNNTNSHTKPSKLRTWTLNLVGLTFIIGGAVWAVWHSTHAATYVAVTTAQPVAASLCSTTSTTSSTSSECATLDERKRLCTLAIEYNFTLTNSSSADYYYYTYSYSYSGQDILPLDSTTGGGTSASGSCHEVAQDSIQQYLTTSTLTVYYNPDNPNDNHYHPPHKPKTMAAIIAAVSSAIGVLFLCTSFLECIL